MIRRRVVVRGRVQGVFFRDNCQHEAVRCGVSGWVRNLPEGSVEAAFEGEADRVEAMVQWCRIGPPHATVDAVEVVEEPPQGQTGFEVTP